MFVQSIEIALAPSMRSGNILMDGTRSIVSDAPRCRLCIVGLFELGVLLGEILVVFASLARLELLVGMIVLCHLAISSFFLNAEVANKLRRGIR